jgi:hypothetical protein
VRPFARQVDTAVEIFDRSLAEARQMAMSGAVAVVAGG